jgi:hypothetical protein
VTKEFKDLNFGTILYNGAKLLVTSPLAKKAWFLKSYIYNFRVEIYKKGGSITDSDDIIIIVASRPKRGYVASEARWLDITCI